MIDNMSMGEMKRHQVKARIIDGCKYIIKLLDILLSVPALFTALTGWNRGSTLSR